MHGSSVLQGMVFKRQVEGDIVKAEKCRVAVYSCPLDIMQTETKGTVLINTAKELIDFNKGEESVVEEVGCLYYQNFVVLWGRLGITHLSLIFFFFFFKSFIDFHNDGITKVLYCIRCLKKILNRPEI